MALRDLDTRSKIALLVLVALGAYAIYVSGGGIDGWTIVFFLVLIPSIVLHEVSHGWAALSFGDSTAKDAGRLTLNPIPHIDPIGTIILPASLLLLPPLFGFPSLPPFGYAKPVPVNPQKMRDPRNQGMLCALAGPAMNIAIAIVFGLLIRFQLSSTPTDEVDSGGFLLTVMFFVGVSNVVLAVFNLIPLPPLDGSAVIERFIPRKWLPGYLNFRRFAIFIVLIFVLLVPGGISLIVEPFIVAWGHLAGFEL